LSDISEPAIGSRAASFAPARRAWGFRLPVTCRGLPALAAGVDMAPILASSVIGAAISHFAAGGMSGETTRALAAALFVALLFVGAVSARKLYEPARLTAGAGQSRAVLGAWIGAFLLLASGVFAGGVGKELSRGAIAPFFVIGAGALLAHRAFWRLYLPGALSGGALKRRPCVLVCGAPAEAASLTAMLERHGYRVARAFGVGDIDAAIGYLRGRDIDDIFLKPSPGGALDMLSVAKSLRVLPIRAAMIPDAALADLAAQPRDQLGDALALEIQRQVLSPRELFAKRSFDLGGAGVALILLAPLMALIAVAIRLESPGPVLFRQTRGGFNGRPFRICKFRSMTVTEDGPGIAQARRGDRRVTRIGAFLRRASLDELPQLFNVLRGEMSLVGPRPHAMSHDDDFAARIENYAFRAHVKAGMTGWAQVHGARGETDTLEKIRRRVDLDLWYVRHWSLALDFSILLRTLVVVVRRDNAY
jgi:putative colanic acid biosynthesis UDP-glucose lipid carrier transferase